MTADAVRSSVRSAVRDPAPTMADAEVVTGGEDVQTSAGEDVQTSAGEDVVTG